MNEMMTAILSIQLFAEASAMFNVSLEALTEKAPHLRPLGPKSQFCSLTGGGCGQ